jgi:uncharacterized cupredoxin-like copper-binding protein
MVLQISCTFHKIGKTTSIHAHNTPTITAARVQATKRTTCMFNRPGLNFDVSRNVHIRKEAVAAAKEGEKEVEVEKEKGEEKEDALRNEELEPLFKLTI